MASGAGLAIIIFLTRHLPRWAELGTVYRYERSGTLSGLFRVRGFTQDDAHVFCLPSQVGFLNSAEVIALCKQQRTNRHLTLKPAVSTHSHALT